MEGSCTRAPGSICTGSRGRQRRVCLRLPCVRRNRAAPCRTVTPALEPSPSGCDIEAMTGGTRTYASGSLSLPRQHGDNDEAYRPVSCPLRNRNLVPAGGRKTTQQNTFSRNRGRNLLVLQQPQTQVPLTELRSGSAAAHPQGSGAGNPINRSMFWVMTMMVLSKA